MTAAAPVCVVLAGGLGTRLRSAVADRPKCLAPVGSRSFLDLLLDRLFEAGIGRVVLSLGHQAEMVQAALASQPHAQSITSVVEPSPLGTGGAIAHVLDAVGLDEVLVANGDTYLDGDLSAMLVPLDTRSGELFRMALVQVDDCGRFGGVEVDARGRVLGFVEKGRHGPGTINAGLYRLCRQALPTAGAGAYSLETEVLPSLVARNAVCAAAIEGHFTDIGVPEDYFRFVQQHER